MVEHLSRQGELVSVLLYVENEELLEEGLRNIIDQENIDIEILICVRNTEIILATIVKKINSLYGDVVKSVMYAENWDQACLVNLQRATGDYVVFGDIKDRYTNKQKFYKQLAILKKEINCIGVSHKIQWNNTNRDGDKAYCLDNRYTMGHAQKLLKTSPLSAIIFKNIFRDTNEWENLFTNSRLNGDERKILLYATQYGYIWRLDERMLVSNTVEQNLSLFEMWEKLTIYSEIFAETWDSGKYFQQKISLAQKALQDSEIDKTNIDLFVAIVSTTDAVNLTRYQKWVVVGLINNITWRIEKSTVLGKVYLELLESCNEFLDEYQVACLLLKGIRKKRKKAILKLLVINRNRKKEIMKQLVLQANEFAVKQMEGVSKKAKRCVGKYILDTPLRKRGFSEYMAHEWRNSLTHDILEKNEIPLRKKIWAWKHGFFSYRLEQYGLTEENYMNFLSDRDYMWLHPINNSYKKWIDDKYTMRAMLDSYKEYLPEYYYHIIKRNGATVYVKLQDCPDQYGNSFQDILALLKEKRVLALKPASGTHGEGFFKLSSDGEHYYVNEVEKQISELQKFFRNFSCYYIITEYVVMHDQLKEIYSGSVNTVRMMTINKDGNNPKIMNAYMRIGSSKTGFTDNVAYGGVFAQIDLKDGRYFNAEQSKNHVIHQCLYHPDTNTKIEGYLPNWELIIQKVTEIAGYLPQLEYLGFDIVITPKGFKILEINVHQDLHRYPNYGKEVHEYFMYKLDQKKRRYGRK